jgi:glyoxylase-like metal-dependent hydrolase (beta-lactamase superfamily II)
MFHPDDPTSGWRLQTLEVGPLQMNAQLLCAPETAEAILVDPGDEPDLLLDAIADSGCRLTALVCTHGHFDHVSAAAAVQKVWDLPLLHHPDETPLLTGLAASRAAYGFPPVPAPRLGLLPADTLPFAGGRLRIAHVPGHSRGHVLFAWEGHALVGDVIFAGSVGRTDLPGGDFVVLERSIRREIYTLDDATVLHPGHGPDTTVGRERRSNPFVSGDRQL